MAPADGPVSKIRVQYWASARAQAGVQAEEFDLAEGSLADVVKLIQERHPEADHLPALLEVCSYLVGDRPVGPRQVADVPVRAGDTVEVLPPFAGG